MAERAPGAGHQPGKVQDCESETCIFRFLGFRIKVHKGKRNQYVVISHIAPKALDRIKETAKKKVKAIQHSSGEMEEFKAVSDYNSFVMGIHNYYRMATAASPDIQRLAFEIKISIKTGCKSE